MDSMNLRNFRPDNPDLVPENPPGDENEQQLGDTNYREEINTLKIDSLSNRVAIISVIIPCIIGAILVFIYLDVKKRVADVDLTKQNQVDRISQQLEEKLNALDVRIAKNTSDIVNQLPQIKKNQTSLEGQITKLNQSKVDKTTLKKNVGKIETKIIANTQLGKSTQKSIESMKKETATALKQNLDQFNKNTQQIKAEISLFKETFDARLLALSDLSDYEQQIGELRKNLSLLEKKFKYFDENAVTKTNAKKDMEQMTADFSSQIKNINTYINKLDQKLASNYTRLQKDIDILSKTASSISAPANSNSTDRVAPGINIDSTDSTQIEEESLNQ